MTRKSTRKTTASKPASKPASEPKQPESMDSSAREQVVPMTPSTNHRDCYALLTLVAEVTGLFPETTYETSGANAFNTALVVQFTAHETPDLYPLLSLIESDGRVAEVLYDASEDSVLVSFHSNFRTQDSREPFGLAEAHAILTSGGSIGLDEDDDFALEPDPALVELWAENDARLTDPT